MEEKELRELIIKYYNTHSREDTIKEFNLSTKKFYKILNGYKKPSNLIEHKNNRTHESYIEGGKKSAGTQKETWKNKSIEEKNDWKINCKEIQLNLDDNKKEEKINKFKKTYSEKSIQEKAEENKRRSISCKEYWDNLTGKERYDKISIQVEKMRDTCIEKYGVPYNCMRDEARLKGNNSKINQHFDELLNINNIEHTREYTIENYSYDFKVENILIEINPSYTHNITINPFGRDSIAKDYHYHKTLLAHKNEFKCLHVWDWDNEEKIINYLSSKVHLYARELEIKEINDVNTVSEFENKNHFQGYCLNQVICIGLYKGEELIELMTFGKPRYNKNYEYELLRLCTAHKYTVTGGANKIFKYFINKYNPETIISYCDNSKFDGKVYEELGFKLKSAGVPTKHWYNLKTGIHITDNLLRQRGFDQLLGKEYGYFGKGIDNNELMIAHGFVEIYDCGQKTFIWEK